MSMEDIQSSDNANRDEDPYNLNQNKGYESSSTAHKVMHNRVSNKL